MKINIVENKVVELRVGEFSEVSGSSGSVQDFFEDKDVAKFSLEVKFCDNCFYVLFVMDTLTEDEKFIHVKYESKFITDSPIDHEFKQGDFPYVNAPAIAYPFLRAFVSNLTLNAGYVVLMLPSVNFSALRARSKSGQ